jgi:hypothetical protein
MPAYADWGDWVADWGDDVDTAQEKREALQALIVSVLPTTWSVYAAPPAIVTTPAVVIAPRTPYRGDLTFTKEQVSLALRIVVQPGEDALDRIDAVMDLLCRGDQPILDIPSLTEVAIEGVVMATANGGDVMVGTINVTVS